MAGDVKGDLQAYDDINVTPMLDLAYVLLVVFIIMTTASVQGIKVDAPQTRTTASLAKPQTKAITITAAGDVYLDAYPVDMATLEARLAQYKGANPALPMPQAAPAKSSTPAANRKPFGCQTQWAIGA